MKTEQEIEQEIQLRVQFKMGQMMDAFRNYAERHRSLSYCIESNKQCSDNDMAFKVYRDVMGIIKKETDMNLPYDDMLNKAKKLNVNYAVEKIMDRLQRRVRGEFASFLVRIIDDAVNLSEKIE